MDFTDEIKSTERRLENQREYLAYRRNQLEALEAQITTHLMEIQRLKQVLYRLERND